MVKNAIAQSDAVINSDFIAILIAKDRHIVWANPAMHRMFGYELDELVGQATRILYLDQESYEAWGQTAYSAMAENRSWNQTLAMKRKDGSTGWYEFNLSKLAGTSDTAVITCVERTESMQATRQLEESELRYRSIVEDQTEVIARVLPDGTFVYVNETFCRVFGKSADDLIGHRWQQEVAHPDDVPMIEAKLLHMTPKNPCVLVKNRIFLANREIRWMQFVNRGFFTSEGVLKEIQTVGHDVTELKQAQSDLRENQERLELALRGSGLVLWDWNIIEHTVHAGNDWFELLGYTNEELGDAEHQWMKLIHPEDLEQFSQKLASQMEGDTANFENEHRLRHKDGHWVTVEARGKVTLRDKDNRPMRMVGTILNVSHRKRLNDEGIRLLRQIELLIRESPSMATISKEKKKAIECLTKRERQTLELIASGMTSAEIAKHLILSTSTVISHRRNLMEKLDLHSTAEVIRFALEYGVVTSQ